MAELPVLGDWMSCVEDATIAGSGGGVVLVDWSSWPATMLLEKARVKAWGAKVIARRDRSSAALGARDGAILIYRKVDVCYAMD